MNFIFDNTQLLELQNRSKLFSYVNGVLTKTYFKVASNTLTIMFRGQKGALATELQLSNEVADTVYFSTDDYSKWWTVLQKFGAAESISFEIPKRENKLIITNPATKDVARLCIKKYDEDDPAVLVFENFLTEDTPDIVDPNLKLELTDELLENFQLTDSLFVAQDKSNAIGLSKDEVIYSNRMVVLKIHLLEQLDNQLFANLVDEDHIYIHNYFLKLFPLLAKTNPEITFSNDYETIYWEDDSSKLLLASERKYLALPTEEQWNGIKPENEDSNFTVDIGTLSTSLNFFNGLYEESAWKPIEFEIVSNKEINLNYNRPTASARKSLPGVTSAYDGCFLVSSEVLSKIINKIESRFSAEEEIFVNFDDDALGIYCKVNDCYEFVISKMIDSLQ